MFKENFTPKINTQEKTPPLIQDEELLNAIRKVVADEIASVLKQLVTANTNDSPLRIV